MDKIAVLTSGGDAPGMNAAIRAVAREAISKGMTVYGVRNGYEGLINNDMYIMSWNDLGNIIHTGGTILKTARSERFFKDRWIDKAAENLSNKGIRGIVIIGGDGTFNGGLNLSKRGIHVIGIPATIDNDLPYTEYTIGFDTAVNTVLDLISKIRDTSSSHYRTTILEVMGRNSGDIALYSGIGGGADVILIPEKEISIDEILKKVKDGQESGKIHNVIIKAEGVDIPLNELEQLIEGVTGQEARSVVPGYIQRGGSPSAHDRLLAALMGAKAVELLSSYTIENDICTENTNDKHCESKHSDYDCIAIGIQGGILITKPMEQALGAKRKFREDIFEIAKTLS